VLRVSDPQATVWDALLPEEAKRLPEELAAVSEFLDDEAFIAPYREHFSKTVGRPSVPIETVLRMLYLKHRYGLGYETLCKEVADSLTWRRFCRIPLDRPVPHPTTLIKIVRRCGPGTIDALNDALLRKLVATKRLKARKLRVDTTAMDADIDHPTDAGLLRNAVGKATRLVKRIKARGGASRTPFRDRRRSAGRRMVAIVRTFRRQARDRLAEIDRLTADAARIARATMRQARRVAHNLRRALRRRPDGVLGRLLADLDSTLSLTDRLLAQTALRVKGQRAIPDRLISLADPDARTIRRGKPRAPNEFGYKILVAESCEGFVVHHRTHKGNPPDHDQLVPAVEAVAALIGRVPATVVADRGFGPANVERALLERGVKRVGIPRTGRPGASRRALQRTRSFRRMARWRIGIEARISHLKHGFGLKRTRLRTIDGATTWVGLGVWAYNLKRLAVVG
jgi:transposase, IS5 family